MTQSDEGWIKLHRVLLKKAIWKDSTPAQKTILITLLLMANHKQNQWMWNGVPFNCSPGQFVTSLESIKKRCGRGITVKMVRGMLDKLRKAGFLAYEATKTGRLVTIINWDTYQGIENGTGQSTGQSEGKARATNKNVKNVKNKTYTPDFEKWWESYPKRNGKRVGKKQCIEWISKNINSDQKWNELLTCTKNYAASRQARDGFAKDPIRFLRNNAWQDWKEPETAAPDGKQGTASAKQKSKAFAGYE